MWGCDGRLFSRHIDKLVDAVAKSIGMEMAGAIPVYESWDDVFTTLGLDIEVLQVMVKKRFAELDLDPKFLKQLNGEPIDE